MSSSEIAVKNARVVVWPKALCHRSLGQRPRKKSVIVRFGRRPYSPLTKLYAHLIFSTKNRSPFLDSGIRGRVHAYLATVFRDMGAPFVVVGGVDDHVHILFDMGKMHPPARFVEQSKRESSKFVKTLGVQYKKFYWQRGNGMFSVGPTRRAEVEKYVRNQEEHHRTITFQEEFLMFLKRYEVTYDEAYVWD